MTLRRWPDLRELKSSGSIGRQEPQLPETRGAERCSGDLLAFLDADDEWLENKLERQLAVLERETSPCLIGCRAQVVSADGRSLGFVNEGWPVATGIDAWKTLLAANFLSTPTILVPKEVFSRVGGFDAALTIGEDQDLWLRIAQQGPVEFVDEMLVIVHQSEGSLTARCRGLEVATTTALLERHLEPNRHRLTRKEIRHIKAMRYGRLARSVYLAGDLRSGVHLFVRATLNGASVLPQLRFLFRYSAVGHLIAQYRGHRQ